MSNDTHVTDVGGLVHKAPNLVLRVSSATIWPRSDFVPIVKFLQVDCKRLGENTKTATYTMVSRKVTARGC